MDPKDLPLTPEGQEAVGRMRKSVNEQIEYLIKDTPDNSIFAKPFLRQALRHKVAALLTKDNQAF